MKVKLTKVDRRTEDKEGNPYTFKTGKSAGQTYTRISIQTDQHGERWLGGFDGYMTKGWNEGDEVEIIVEENGKWLNFKTPSDKVTRKEFDALDARVKALEWNTPTVGSPQVADAIEKDRMEPPQDQDDVYF